jgi:hypothetical protein
LFEACRLTCLKADKSLNAGIIYSGRVYNSATETKNTSWGKKYLSMHDYLLDLPPFFFIIFNGSRLNDRFFVRFNGENTGQVLHESSGIGSLRMEARIMQGSFSIFGG